MSADEKMAQISREGMFGERLQGSQASQGSPQFNQCTVNYNMQTIEQMPMPAPAGMTQENIKQAKSKENILEKLSTAREDPTVLNFYQIDNQYGYFYTGLRDPNTKGEILVLVSPIGAKSSIRVFSNGETPDGRKCYNELFKRVRNGKPGKAFAPLSYDVRNYFGSRIEFWTYGNLVNAGILDIVREEVRNRSNNLTVYKTSKTY